MDELDVRDLPQRTFVRQIRALSTTDSTNRVALAWSGQLGDRELPALVISEQQTDGRGRGSNRWWSSPGALTFSLILAPEAWGVPPARWPALSLSAGGAVAAAVQSAVVGADVRLKWPNDVYLDGRKLAGVLIESPPMSTQRLVIGIGINVNNSLAAAPAEVRARAIALADVTGREHSRTDLLTSLLQQWAHDLTDLARGDTRLQARWRRLCFLAGRSVVITDSGRTIAGTCLGLDDDGALRVQTGQSVERMFSGVVTDYE